MPSILRNLKSYSFFFASGILFLLSFLFWLAPTTRPSDIVNAVQESMGAAVAAVMPQEPLFEYIEVIGGCGPYYTGGDCVELRAGPSLEYRIIERLRIGVVLKVEKKEVVDGLTWYKIDQNDEWLRYPERVKGEWYVFASPTTVREFLDVGTKDLSSITNATSTKKILVDRSEQMLYAYDGDTLFTQLSISTGIQLTPTPRGTFTVYRKTPSRYMQGPLPGISEKYYDLPGVPWNLYFSEQGAVIHGAYWHDKFGQRWSSGCVNVPLSGARAIYEWADVGTTVVVRD